MNYHTIFATLWPDVLDRINKADNTYSAPASAHEMLGVIAEEYAELIEAIRTGKSGSVEWEALDLAAAAIRLAYACNVGNATTTPALDAFAKRSGFLDARETSPQKGLPL